MKYVHFHALVLFYSWSSRLASSAMFAIEIFDNPFITNSENTSYPFDFHWDYYGYFYCYITSLLAVSMGVSGYLIIYGLYIRNGRKWWASPELYGQQGAGPYSEGKI